MSLAVVVLWVAGLAVVAECGARVWHRLRYRIPYTPRIFGTYPYAEFLERAPAPLGNRLKKGYAGGSVAINALSLRGPELREGESVRRVLLLGESDFFGVKLPEESQSWRAKLQERITRQGHGEWDVCNGGHPGYNVVQHQARWEELRDVPWDIVLLRMGGNDITQAYAMEQNWKPGRGWPLKFLQGMPAGQPRLHRVLLHSCLYYVLWGWKFFVRPFGNVMHEFLPENWEQVRELVLENTRQIIDDAHARGARVAIVSPATLSRPDMPERERRQMESLAEKWQSFQSGSGPKLAEMTEVLRAECDVPYLDLDGFLAERNDRVSLYYDQVHWNPRGQEVVADFLYDELKRLGWLG